MYILGKYDWERIPASVPKKNGMSGTSMSGLARFMNQFGRIGVIRKKRI